MNCVGQTFDFSAFTSKLMCWYIFNSTLVLRASPICPSVVTYAAAMAWTRLHRVDYPEGSVSPCVVSGYSLASLALESTRCAQILCIWDHVLYVLCWRLKLRRKQNRRVSGRHFFQCYLCYPPMLLL